ncbi:sigma-70 family RNA polymerase sigma factor [Pseudoflavitalea sp. G-6-1-2]|uniref:RNA polymerase sigma factor n=1 Tax=Pseudoflavitalea sp. G-6-1-2 TaxID=2728841 RepID=UPI00146DB4C5|nr:sigma-70 family RNA polymerase sigma factor [Pseudoflavitalea sp. G-6-1-2]NML21677.1 sigma-70 family RNA polymerase sigma factor [Pseudoflavitalea sp. G-6-1-2]
MITTNHILPASLSGNRFPDNDASGSAGDQEYLVMLHHHQDALMTAVSRLTRNRQTAEDIVQDTFLKFWEKRTAISNDNIGGWLYRVASNLAYKNAKRESVRLRVHSLFQSFYATVSNDVEETLLRKENKGAITETYKRLPEKQLEVFRLSNVAGLSRNEIAHYLNISPNTVRNHLARATRFIKENIQCACLLLFFSAISYIFFNSGGTKVHLRDFIEVQGRTKKNVLTEISIRKEYGGTVIDYPVQDLALRKIG